MKSNKLVLLVLTFTTSLALNAQETTTQINNRKLEPKRAMKVVNFSELNTTPEQIAKNKTQELMSKVKLTEEQAVSVNNLFLKIENRKASLADKNQDEKEKALIELQSIEDKELNSILSSSQQKLNSESKKVTKTATSM